jgi:membrane protease YdiL (CAAX protease family)
VVLAPLLVIAGIYSAAYGIAWLAGIERAAPVWQGARMVAINVVLNLPLAAVLGLMGSIGEELGWRGYLQPRLDQLGVRASLLVVAPIEVLYHVPLIVLGGYLASGSLLITLGLACASKLTGIFLWTYGSYRLRSIWVAFWFHTLHNALSQLIFPKVFGVGAEHVLGEMGLLPVGCQVAAALALLVALRLRGRPLLPLPWAEPQSGTPTT